MKVGFTGTREGMSVKQREQLDYLFSRFSGGVRGEFHYGTHQNVQLTADHQAALIADRYFRLCVPHHARTGGELARNREIVRDVDVLIAAPRTDREELRSGTWSTVRYARRKGIPVIMLSRGRT